MKTGIAKLRWWLQIRGMIEPSHVPGVSAARHSDQADGGEDLRVITATVSGLEFGAAQWAAKRVFRDLGGGRRGAVTLAEFFRSALVDKVREVARAEVARGKPVPADIAAVLDRNRDGK